MGFLDNAFKKLKIEAEKALNDHQKKNSDSSTTTSDVPSEIGGRTQSDSAISVTMSEVMHYGSTATRWEKAVVATNAIVGEVTNFDPDGVEIICVGGDSPDGSLDISGAEEIEWHEGIKDTKGLEATITTREPGGPCPLGKAMEEVLTKALEKDLEKTPCSVLVLTAGKPDDSDILEEALRSASQVVADNGGVETCPLSVTFIQIGNDQDVSDYLKYLDKKMVGISEETGEKTDIVDTMGFQELKDTVFTMREHIAKAQMKSRNHGAILGAVAGAAIGVGGMYLQGKHKAKKRVQSGSWGGQWKCSYDGEEIATLTVKDDKEGNLTIDGLEDTMQGVYFHNDDDDDGTSIDSDEFFIRFTEPEGDVIEGTFDSENFVLEWSDGTMWEAVNKTGWAHYVGAATAGAAIAGTAGYAIRKRFFQKIGDEEPCDYVLVVDRSAKMAITDGNA